MSENVTGKPDIDELELLGGVLCLDFANTVDRDRSGTTRHEYLQDFDSLVDWSRHIGISSSFEATQLKRYADGSPESRMAVFNDALDLRSAIQRTFTAIATGEEPESAHLIALHRHYVQAIDHAHLSGSGRLWNWEFLPDDLDLRFMMRPVALSAIDLLRHGRLGLLKRCPGDDGQCGWLFLDMSKNRSRRWCSMQTCGSRDKMRNRYHRQTRE